MQVRLPAAGHHVERLRHAGAELPAAANLDDAAGHQPLVDVVDADSLLQPPVVGADAEIARVGSVPDAAQCEVVGDQLLAV